MIALLIVAGVIGYLAMALFTLRLDARTWPEQDLEAASVFVALGWPISILMIAMYALKYSGFLDKPLKRFQDWARK